MHILSIAGQQVCITNGRLCSARERNEVSVVVVMSPFLISCLGSIRGLGLASHPISAADAALPGCCKADRKHACLKQELRRFVVHEFMACQAPLQCSSDVVIVAACHWASLHLCCCARSAACQRCGASQNTETWSEMPSSCSHIVRHDEIRVHSPTDKALKTLNFCCSERTSHRRPPYLSSYDSCA